MSTVVIRYDGIDITPRVIISDCTFMSAARGTPGTCQFTVKDLALAEAFVVGKTLSLTIDGQLQWAGFVTTIGRSFFFPVDDPDCEGLVPRGFTITGVDYNILLNKRFIYDKASPTTLKLTAFPAGTIDQTIIKTYFAHSDLGADGITSDRVEAVDTPSVDAEISGAASWSFNEFLSYIGRHIGSIWYINADKKLVYTDVDTPNSPFGISDNPGPGEIGVQRLELTLDGTKLRNDVMVWGAGQGDTKVVFKRLQDSASIATHGRWQDGEFNYGVWKQATVDKIADYYVYGSPQNRRGGKDDAPALRCRLFTPGFQVAQKVPVRLEVHDFTDVVPIRQVTITFFSPTEPIWDITLSHEIDDPYSTFDPMPPIHINVPTLEGPHIVWPTFYDQCALSRWEDNFSREVATTVSPFNIFPNYSTQWGVAPEGNIWYTGVFIVADYYGVTDGEGFMRDIPYLGTTSQTMEAALIDLDMIRTLPHWVFEARWQVKSNIPDWGFFGSEETGFYEQEGIFDLHFYLYALGIGIEFQYDSYATSSGFPSDRRLELEADSFQCEQLTMEHAETFFLNTWYRTKLEVDAEARLIRLKWWKEEDELEPGEWLLTNTWGFYYFEADPPSADTYTPNLEEFNHDLLIYFTPKWEAFEFSGHYTALHLDYVRVFDPLVTAFVDHFKNRELPLTFGVEDTYWGIASDGTPWRVSSEGGDDNGMGVQPIPDDTESDYYFVNVGVMAFEEGWNSLPQEAVIDSIPAIWTGDWMFETRFRFLRTGVNDATDDTVLVFEFRFGADTHVLRLLLLLGPNEIHTERWRLISGNNTSPSYNITFDWDTWYRVRWQYLSATGYHQARIWKDQPNQEIEGDIGSQFSGNDQQTPEPSIWHMGVTDLPITEYVLPEDRGFRDFVVWVNPNVGVNQPPDTSTARLEFSFFRIGSPNPCISDLIAGQQLEAPVADSPVGWNCEENVQTRPISRPDGESVLYAYFAVAAPFTRSTLEVWVDGLFVYPSQLNLNGANEGWFGISEDVQIGGFDPRDPIKTIRICYYAPGGAT